MGNTNLMKAPVNLPLVMSLVEPVTKPHLTFVLLVKILVSVSSLANYVEIALRKM